MEERKHGVAHGKIEMRGENMIVRGEYVYIYIYIYIYIEREREREREREHDGQMGTKTLSLP